MSPTPETGRLLTSRYLLESGKRGDNDVRRMRAYGIDWCGSTIISFTFFIILFWCCASDVIEAIDPVPKDSTDEGDSFWKIGIEPEWLRYVKKAVNVRISLFKRNAIFADKLNHNIPIRENYPKCPQSNVFVWPAWASMGRSYLITQSWVITQAGRTPCL